MFITTSGFTSLPTSETPEQLFDYIRNIKSQEMRSNSQWTIQTLKEKYAAGKVWIKCQRGLAIILLFDNEGVIRLSYYCEDPHSLLQMKGLIPTLQAPMVCDLLGKEPKVTMQAEELGIVFQPYAQYKRMICTELISSDSIDISDVEPAHLGDEVEILEMLHGEFDVLTARMPNLDLIRQRIENEEVFVVRKDNMIAGFINFESKGLKAALLDYVMVRPEYRMQHIAKKIWNFKLKTHNESKYYYLWVNMARQSAIRFHERNGFRFDGMVDNIFKVN